MHMHRLLLSLALLGASASALAASTSSADNTQIDPEDCPGYDAQNVSWVGDTRLTADLVLRGPCALFGTNAGGKDHDVERLKLEVVVETREFLLPSNILPAQ